MHVHKEGRPPAREDGQNILSPQLLRAYIAEAKSHDPSVPEHLTGLIPAPLLTLARLFQDVVAA